MSTSQKHMNERIKLEKQTEKQTVDRVYSWQVSVHNVARLVAIMHLNSRRAGYYERAQIRPVLVQQLRV